MGTIADDILMHYGVKRRSGRYPWGSGKEPYQHSGDFLSRVNELKSQGLSEKEICETLGMTTTDYRMQYRRASHERRDLLAARAQSLREDGLSLNQIAAELGFANDSSVRSLLNENTQARKNRADETAEILKKELEEKGVLDVGAGVERELGVSRQTLQEALFILETQGYSHFGVGLGQVTNKGQQTTYELISKSDKPLNEQQRDIYNDPSLIKPVGEYHSTDGGKTFNKREYPASIDSNRVGIRYGDQGGVDKDGVIEIRRGVEDLNLGNSHYAQVRILVDGSHYLKGMAMYSDDLPDGVDIMFNTNKKSGTPMESVLKPITNDPNNPFGAYIKADGQSKYVGKDRKEHLSAINKLKEEGDWDTMSRNLSSQFLSKQSKFLVKQQLDLTYKGYDDELSSILALENPTVRKKMLQDFADTCDGAAVHLKAAALPRQTTKVILPVTTLKDNEVYAPTYKDGEQVALVRYPHGGIFEIPVLTVNNKNKGAIRTLGKNVTDAIGITPKSASQLSGADFDGDQVIVIPIGAKSKILSKKPLKELEGFEPKIEYSTEGKTNVRLMRKSEVQKEMGMISNLITDMTLKGAPDSDIAKAVKHSMVVIDAYKHKLDYKQSEIDQDISTLKKRYQGYTTEEGKEKGGASTLLSRRKQTVAIPERKGSPRINPETGELEYKESGRTYVDVKTGKVVKATTKVPSILNTPDVHSMSSGTPIEEAYADYANKLKALSNRARKELASTPRLQRNPTSAKTYAKEVESLDAKLNLAALNAPRERQAQALAKTVIKAQTDANPDMTKKEIRKLSQMAIEEARGSVGASGKDTRINITDKEWEAIQAGAISDNKLSQILRYADKDQVRKLATPKETTKLPQAKINRIKNMQALGYTIAEIADAIGVSSSTVSSYIRG
jgi:orotate phosphoribosyltransferase-like protein